MASRWRDHSRRIILATLATLPPDATDAERRKAVSASYPFGERAMHPYKAWLKEVRSILGPKDKPNMVIATEKRVSPQLRMTPKNVKPPFYIYIACKWCELKGCLICGNKRKELDGIIASTTFYALLTTCRQNVDDDVPRGVIADWLDECGTEMTAELAGMFRATTRYGESP